MNAPTTGQRKWAADALGYTAQCYDEQTREGIKDFTPMLRLIDHIRSSTEIELLSVWKSMAHLSVASASHLMTPYILTDGAPCLSITQDDNEFVFRDASGKTRKCPFDQAADLFDTQLVRLRICVDEYDAAESRKTKP